MPAWFFGTAIALLVGTAASLYLWFIRRRDEENAIGLLALAGMRWREFSRLVLAAMQRRGYEQIAAGPEDAREQSANFLLGKEGRQWLLACKHGSAYRIGSATVEEIAADIRLRGAQGGILVTQGMLDHGGREKAARHDIEIIDGKRLWPELKPLVDESLRKHVVDNATGPAKRHIGIAWLGAFTLGIAVALALPRMFDRTGNTAATADAGLPAQTAPVAQPAAAPPAAAVLPAAAIPTEQQLERERAAVAKAIAGIDGLVRGIWISRSTIAVDRTVGEELAWSLVCTELARHPDLSLTRVQMNPPPGSGEQVRWRQCEGMRR